MRRRPFLLGTLGLLGLGAAVWGGTTVACAAPGGRLAALAPGGLRGLPDPVAVGRAWARLEGRAGIETALAGDRDLAAMALLPDADARVALRIARDFRAGDTVEAAGWIVTRLEARLAASALG